MKRLYDQLPDEIKTKFNPKKKASKKLAAVYKRIGLEKKYKRVNDCGNTLVYEVSDSEGYPVTLKQCLFCKDKLCPLCVWRKELKMFHQVSRIVDRLQAEEYNFVFVTLTVKNCENSGKALKDSLDHLNKSYVKLTRLKRIQSFLKGAFRSIEVTYDGNEYITPEMYHKKKKYYKTRVLKVGDKNPNYDQVHPHMHLIWVVPKSYFQSEEYLKQAELCELWKQSLGVDYDPIVDIRAVTGKKLEKNGKIISYDLKSAVAEVCKYAVKSTDYLNYSDEINNKIVQTLAEALSRRRLVSYYGVFADVRSELDLDDPEDGDLVHVGDENNSGRVLLKVYFRWNNKLGSYEHYNAVVNLDIICDDEERLSG